MPERLSRVLDPVRWWRSSFSQVRVERILKGFLKRGYYKEYYKRYYKGYYNGTLKGIQYLNPKPSVLGLGLNACQLRGLSKLVQNPTFTPNPIVSQSSNPKPSSGFEAQRLST